jgi:hypothetical protein
MLRSLARQLCKPYTEELTEKEIELVFGAEDFNCGTAAGPCRLPGGGTVRDPRRVDCA